MDVQLGSKLRNAVFLPSAIEYIKTNIDCGECFRLSPTEALTEQTGTVVTACDLLVRKEDSTEHAHFAKFGVDSGVKDWLKDGLEDLSMEHVDKLKNPLFPRIASCIGTILEELSRLRGGYKPMPCTVRMECELRSAIAYPIIDMICRCWGYAQG